jgi:DNA polymerase II small subunit
MDDAVKKIYDANIRLTPGAFEVVKNNEKGEWLADRIISLGEPIVNEDDINKLLTEEEKIPLPVEIKRASDFHPISKEHSPSISVMDKQDISGKSRCTGSIEDFVSYFRNRFDRTKKMLRARVTDRPVINTSSLKKYEGQDGRIIGMVTEKRLTKKENLLVEIEDEEGSALVVIPKTEKCFETAKRLLLLDEVVAFDVRVGAELLICSDMLWPDIPVIKEQKLCENDLAIVYLSDLHLGSRYFTEDGFNSFIKWINGLEGDKELAGKVKYIEIAGDIVDGIGIYPNQEKELIVKDIYKQYELFDNIMEKIPDYIEVIISPGNHDGVRRAEPQPSIPSDMIKSDVTRLGSPSYVQIEGLTHLVYHGTSLDSIIGSVSGFNYAHPEEPMLELLKHRHLSPIYGDNLIVPEARDYMVIEEVPDIVHMGHVHKNGHLLYRGTTIINSGTFQERTDFQVKMGHSPSPGVVPVYETRYGRMRLVNFKKGG